MNQGASNVRRAAVIGCGDISGVHLTALAEMPDVELVGVCDLDPDRLRAAATTHGIPGFRTHAELLAAVHPEVVHICTPHDQHVPIALDALEAGVNVILEKPLGETREAGARLVEAAERSRAKIAVCFQNRYNEPVQFVRRELLSGDLGQIRGASATVIWSRGADYYRNRPWRGTWSGGGGGLLMNQAIHTIDLLQWLLGEPVRVRGGIATRFLEGVIEVEDTADIVIEHSTGARSVFYATLAHVANEPVDIEIVTEHATISLREEATVRYADGRVTTVAPSSTATGERAYWGLSHAALIRDFYDRLEEEEAFWISPRQAQISLGIIQDVYDQSVPGRVRAVQTQGV